MPAPTTYAGPMNPTERQVMDVLTQAAREGQPVRGFSELADLLGLGDSTAKHVVYTLAAKGALDRRPDGFYLGPSLALAFGRRQASGTERPCITCRRPFLSEGPHHRMCDACRETAEPEDEYVLRLP